MKLGASGKSADSEVVAPQYCPFQHSFWSVRFRTIFQPPLKEGSMNIAATYLWQTVYFAAALETDNAAMPTRIYEALAAIEQRRLNPIEAGGIEEREMENAQRALLTLKAERAGSISASSFDFVEARQPQSAIGSKSLNSPEP
jgi:hypothetical protein